MRFLCGFNIGFVSVLWDVYIIHICLLPIHGLYYYYYIYAVEWPIYVVIYVGLCFVV